MSDAQCEHAILDRLHHRVEYYQAGDSGRDLSGDIVGQRVHEFGARECGAFQYLWSGHWDSILLLHVPGIE
jgi:hypothetical protein